MARNVDKDIPEGFDVQVGRDLGDGWIRKGPGVVVQGRLLGRFIGTQKDDDGVFQAFYQVRLDVQVPAVRKNPETKEKEEVMLNPGEILNVGEHKALEELSPRTRDGGVYDVWFKYEKQDKVPNSNRTFWSVKGPRLKVIKPAQHAPIPEASQRAGGVADGDIPF